MAQKILVINKERIMKKFLLLLAICILALSSCKLTSPSDNDVTTLRIINRTDVVFNRLKIRIAGEYNWDQTFVGDFTRGTHEIDFYRYLDNQKRYDIQLEQNFFGGKTATHSNIKISENAIIEFDYEHLDDASSMDVTSLHINNLTGRDFTEIMIGEAGQTTWLYMKTVSIPKDETYILNNIYPPLDRYTQYRIRLRVGNQTATKTNETVWMYKTITFEVRDLN